MEPSHRVKQLPPSGIRRFFDLLSSLTDVISLGVGEPDFPTPWTIREQAIHSIEKGYTTYTSNAGLPELRGELSRYLAKHCGVDYDPGKELLITVGVSQGLDLAMRALVNPGDEVLVPDPGYVAYVPCVRLAGGEAIPTPTSPETGFKLQARDISPRLTPRSKGLLLNYPANPTGAVMGREELLPMAELALSHNLWVVSDEVYARLVYGVEHTCFASLPGMRERTILLGGFSKTYAMTGWRVGYAAGPAEIIQAMARINQYTTLCAPIMGQMAALEALRNGEEAVREMVREYDRRRRFVLDGLRQLGLPCVEPQGSFYVFPSIQATGLSSQEFAEKLLLEERVAVVPGSAFGGCGEGYIRCCYAVSLPDLEEALKRLSRFLVKIKAQAR